MDKKQVVAVLNEIGLLLELKGENPFKSRAYYNGARIVEMLQEDLGELVQKGRLNQVKGIGEALSQKISELVLTGRLAYYEELKASIPPGVMELLRIPGLGPKKAKVLYEDLGITSVGELAYACKENRLVTLKGFGSKTQEKLLQGIDYIRRFQGRYRYAEVLPAALELLKQLKACPGVQEASLAGSIRRCKEIIKDIDLVAAAVKPEEAAQCFTGISGIQSITGQGPTKVSIILASGINADLRVVEPAQYPYALHHFTGSKEHNTALRHLAKEQCLKINEYGVFKGEEIIPCHSEEDVFRVLGMSHIPPELRENNGEIEAALAGKIPELVEMKDIQGIFHVHTTYSDGADTLEAMVLGALHQGYRYLGISDHSQAAFYARGLKVDDIYRQQEEIKVLRKKYPEILILSGVETDIKPNGLLDYNDEILELFDFVIASVHSHFQKAEGDLTSRIIQALSHPAVTMLGHPTGRLLLAREGYRVQVEDLLEAAKKYGVIMELNASPARLDLDWRYLKQAREMGIKISINPDAHRVRELDDTYYGVAVARKGWLEKDDVFNAYDLQWIAEYLQDRKSKWV